MNRPAVLALTAALAAPALGAGAPAGKTAAKPALARASGVVEKVYGDRVVVKDKAGTLTEFIRTPATRVTRDGKPAKIAAMIGDIVVKAEYKPKTKELASLTLKTAPVDPNRPSVSGEVAGTDILRGSISVKMGGGATTEFAVGDATKITREADGKPAAPAALEAVKVGDRVEVLTKDWKTADELRVRAPAP